MGAAVIVDARGLSCPLPALHAKDALEQAQQGAVEVLVDSITSRDNVARTGRRLGWTVSVKDDAEGDFRLVMTK